MRSVITFAHQDAILVAPFELYPESPTQLDMMRSFGLPVRWACRGFGLHQKVA